MSTSPHRSFERITRDDLVRLVELALQDFEQLYARSEYSRPYKARLRLICLCQGSARHFLHGDRGVQDFDMWGFFEEIPRHPFPYRRRGTRDFGPSKFGRNPDDGPEFVGRRVDVIGRSIPISAWHAASAFGSNDEPPPPNRMRQMSPGINRINKNTSAAAPKRVGIVSSTRLRMY